MANKVQLTIGLDPKICARLREVGKERNPSSKYRNLGDIVEVALADYFARIDSGEADVNETIVCTPSGQKIVVGENASSTIVRFLR